MKRGDIYYIENLRKDEDGNNLPGRPAVIVSSDAINATSNTVEICYLAREPFEERPTHVLTRATNPPATILCEKINTVYGDRCRDYIGRLSDSEMMALDTSLVISLGIDAYGGSTQKETIAYPIEPKTPADNMRELLEEMKEAKKELLPSEEKPQIIKLKAERDLYRKIYHELLETVTKGAKA